MKWKRKTNNTKEYATSTVTLKMLLFHPLFHWHTFLPFSLDNISMLNLILHPKFMIFGVKRNFPFMQSTSWNHIWQQLVSATTRLPFLFPVFLCDLAEEVRNVFAFAVTLAKLFGFIHNLLLETHWRKASKEDCFNFRHCD